MGTLTARVCVVRLLLLITAHISLAQGQNIFFTAPTFVRDTGDQGRGQMVTADFNRDGKPDLITADGTVLLGNGDGTFTKGTALPFGGTSIATGDFNGDGKPDVALTYGSTTFYIFLGNGDGTFQAPLTTNLPVHLVSIVVADVNNDGKPDLLVTSSDVSALVLVVLGNGDGTFQQGAMYPTGSPPGEVPFLVIGDFNGDGKPDIALVGNRSVQVLLGNGDGTFQTAITSTTTLFPIAVVAKDFNGDGVLDLAISDRVVFATGKTFILLGNGNGTFSAPGSPLPASGALAVGDLNGDGKPDLVVQQEPFVTVFLGSGNGTFTLKDTYYSRRFQDRVLVADFNGDGKLDVAAGNTMLLGNGDGSLRGNAAVPLSPAPYGVASVTGDFNRDGSADLAVVANPTGAPDGGTPSLYILLNDGTGKLSLAHTYMLPVRFHRMATADLRGNGKLDLVVISEVTQLILNVMLGNGDGTFGPPTAFPTGLPADVNGLAFADFNGDQKPDLAILGDQLTVFLGNGDGTFGPPASFFTGDNPTSFVTGDFNNDGIVDVAVSSSAGLGILLGKGDGTFQPLTVLPESLRVLASADLNGDGNADLIGSDRVLLGNGNGTFHALPLPHLDFFAFSVSVVDVDGDGKLDLIFSDSTDYVNLLSGNGDGTFGNPIAILPTGPGFVLINQDRRPDLAVNASRGVVTLLNTGQRVVPDFSLSASSTATVTVSPGQTATYTILVAPVDGFNQSVAFSCSGLPAQSTCTVSPNPVSLNGPSGAQATVTITTGHSQSFAPPFGTSVRLNARPRSFLLGLLGMFMIMTLPVWHRNRQRPWARMVTLAVLLLAGMTIISCGAGSSQPGSTQPGTYTITVSGRSTSGSTTLTHNINLTLIVH